MEDEITTIFATELSFYGDLIADVNAGKITGYSTFAVRDAYGNEAIRVWLPNSGTRAIADGTRFAELDWEESGRIEVHAPEEDDELDQAALDA